MVWHAYMLVISHMARWVSHVCDRSLSQNSRNYHEDTMNSFMHVDIAAFPLQDAALTIEPGPYLPYYPSEARLANWTSYAVRVVRAWMDDVSGRACHD
jgi:hypothetical protein